MKEVENNLAESHEKKLKETLDKLLLKYGSDEELKNTLHLYRGLKDFVEKSTGIKEKSSEKKVRQFETEIAKFKRENI